VCEYVCTRVRVCLSHDTSSMTPPLSTISCLAVDCGTSPIVRHAQMTVEGDNKYKDRAIYHCLDGYWFSYKVYSYTVTCQANGSWSNVPNYCTGRLMRDEGQRQSLFLIFNFTHVQAFVSLNLSEMGYILTNKLINGSSRQFHVYFRVGYLHKVNFILIFKAPSPNIFPFSQHSNSIGHIRAPPSSNC